MLNQTYGEVMKEYGVRLKKRLGQHFMTDPGLLNTVASLMVPDNKWVALEIGAGIGTLTKQLCQKAKWVYALEIDRELEEPVAKTTGSLQNLTWIWGDALKFDLSGRFIQDNHPESPLLLCGNLPYYVTSEVLYSALVKRSEWSRLVFVVQEEVGRRMAEPPGSRDFGRLSLWCQYRASVQIERKIPRGAFMPPPDVGSCLVSLDVFPEFPLTTVEEKVLDEISRKAFSQRRKTMLNSLSLLAAGKEELLRLGDDYSVDLYKRPEDMAIADYVVLAKAMTPLVLPRLGLRP
jgi:16S rRNA (adenine1518-N6/adenine1519-N6)-dimethyltransferase